MTLNTSYNDDELEERIACLQEQGFPKSLARYVCQQVVQQFPLRIWIVDNSLSMSECDGTMLVNTKTPKHVKTQDCTRWEELCECVRYHAQLAALLQAPTQFHLLNPPSIQQSYVAIGELGADKLSDELDDLEHILHTTRPSGATPLVSKLQQILDSIQSLAPSLHSAGQKIVVVVATDGKPTDHHGYNTRSVERALERLLQQFQSLPVWMVIRLCTSDAEVVEYYQSLDSQLELQLEVLDDYLNEAKEVYRINPWLNYSLTLHRCREMGFPHKLFDLLDERQLSLDEIKEFVELVFRNDNNKVRLVDPHVDWNGFVQQIYKLNQRNSRPWNPITQRVGPWMDVSELQRLFRPYRYYRQLFVVWTVMIVSLLLIIVSVPWNDLLDYVLVELESNSKLQGVLFMAVGTVVSIVVMGRDPRILLDKRLLLLVGGVLALFVGLQDGDTKMLSADFWQGLLWILIGVVLLAGVVLWNLSPSYR